MTTAPDRTWPPGMSRHRPEARLRRTPCWTTPAIPPSAPHGGRGSGGTVGRGRPDRARAGRTATGRTPSDVWIRRVAPFGPSLGGEHGREQGEGGQAHAHERDLGVPAREGQPTVGRGAVAAHRTAGGAGRGLGGLTAGPRVEVAAGAPAEDGLGEQHFEAALEMAQLLRGETAVAARHEMPLHIGQQTAAAADRDVEESVVVTAFRGGREFPMGTCTALSELLSRLVQRGGRGDLVHAQQTGRYGYGFGLDLGVPQQALGGTGECAESTFRELPPFRGAGPRRA